MRRELIRGIHTAVNRVQKRRATGARPPKGLRVAKDFRVVQDSYQVRVK